MSALYVLVPFDFREKSKAALKYAFDLAEYSKAEILLLYVISPSDFITELFKTEKAYKILQAKAERELEQAVLEWQKLGKKISYRIERGDPGETILSVADSPGILFIVMARGGSEGEKYPLGTIAREVIAGANCPVVTVPGHRIAGNWKMENIVLPLDLTRERPDYIANAMMIALFFRSTIHLVGVVSGCIALRKSRLFFKMEKIRRQIEYRDIRCTSELYCKSEKGVQQVILEHAKKMNGDLLIIMTRQEACFTSTFIGHTAEALLNESSLPVISYTVNAMHKSNKIVQFVDPLRIFGKEIDKSKERLMKLISRSDINKA